MTNQTHSVTTLLGRGVQATRMPAEPPPPRAAYRELREQAARYMRRERQNHTLQPTALVHEAYLRLIGQERLAW